MPPDRWQPPGEKGLGQRSGRRGEITEHAEAAKRLAEHAPPLQAELVADELGIVHDGIRPETGKVTCPLLRAHFFESRNRRRTPSPPLVQHQHPVVLQSALQPAGRPRVRSRAGCLHAGAALQEHEEGPVPSLRYRHLSGEERDLLAVRLGVAQWRGELVFCQDQPGDVRGNSHSPESGTRRRLQPRAGSSLGWRRVRGIAAAQVQECIWDPLPGKGSLAAGQNRSRWKLGDDAPLRCRCGYGWCMATERPSHDQVTEATASAEASMRPQSVPVNVYETPAALVVLAPLPAVTAKDVTIEVSPGSLRFWARLRSAGPRDFLVHEWEYGCYEREIELPDGYGQGVEATLTNGQLAIRVLRGHNTGPLSTQPTTG